MREKILHQLAIGANLPPAPEMISKLRSMIEDPDVGINEVAKLIQSDPILSGKLLKLANSVYGSGTAFFATDLNRALSRLGLKMAMDLTYSLKIPSLFSEQSGISFQQFWRYSLALGVVSSRLAERYGATMDEVSHAYLGGLMRNMGTLLFLTVVPDEYCVFLNELREKVKNSPKRRKLLPLETFEKQQFGVSSPELASLYMRQQWELDQEVVDYVESRPKVLQPKLASVIEIGRYILAMEKIPDGIISQSAELPEKYLKEKLDISPSYYKELQTHLKASLQILG